VSWTHNTGSLVLSSLSVADVDLTSAGSEIIVTATIVHQIQCLSCTGNLLWSYALDDESWVAPMIANLGAAGDPAIIVGTPFGDKVYCLNHDGTLRWSVVLGSNVCSSPLVANIDTLLAPEIIVGCTDGKLYCLDNNGATNWSFYCGNIKGHSPAVANVDGIGTPEVIFTVDNKLYCLNHDGTLRWEVTIPRSNSALTRSGGASPSIADIDSDGDPEIVIGDMCFEADGTLRWHYGLPTFSTSAIADLDYAGGPEVVTWCHAESLMYVFRDNGFGVPPVVVWTSEAVDASGTSWTVPVICDVECDGSRDVIWVATDYLRMYDGLTGTVFYENTLFKTNTANEHGAVAADVDDDGIVEIVAIYEMCSIALLEDDVAWAPCQNNRFSGELYHVSGINPDLSVPRSEPHSWTLHNTWLAQLTNCPTRTEENRDGDSSRVFLNQNYPNPFTRTTVIKYRIPDNRKASIKIYDLSGTAMKSFDRLNNRSVNHVIWDGKNEAGEKVKSGVYFSVLQCGETRETRKLTLTLLE
jgi:hypothetical protein